MKRVTPAQRSALQTAHSSSLLNTFLVWVIPPALFILAGILFYRPSLPYPFQFDDLANITKFFAIRHLTLPDLFFAHSRWISTWLNAVNFRMGSFEPYYFRMFNVTFHLFTAVLIYYFFAIALSRLKQESFFRKNAYAISICTTLLFLLHPVQTQTVSYVIQGRMEGLAGLFVMALALCFLGFSYIQSFMAKAGLTLLICIIAAFSCGTKEISIISPLLLLVVDWFFVAQGDFASLKKRWWVHLAIWTTVVGFYIHYLKPGFLLNIVGMKIEHQNNIGNTITENRLDKITAMHYFISEFKVILHYLGIFLWPFNISVDYDWIMVKGFFAPDCFFPFLVLVAIFTYILYLLRNNKIHLTAFGLLWFFIAIAPRATIMPSTELIADYKTYLSSVGWLFVLAAGLVYGLQYLAASITSVSRVSYFMPVQLGALCILALPLGYLTYSRNTVWRTAEEFWWNILQNAPKRARVYNNYGVALSERGKYKEAIPYFKKAAKMDHLYPDPLNNLAVAYSSVDEIDLAIDALKQGLTINPYYPEAYNNLASFLIQKKDYDTAEKMLTVALQLRPYYGKAFYNWGRVWMEKAEAATDPKIKAEYKEKGWQLYKDACVKADFDTNVIALNEYAKLSAELLKYDDAIFALKKMVSFSPDLHDAVFMLGNMYFFKKEYADAMMYYQEMLRRVPNDPRALNNMGECYYNVQNFGQALTYFTQAITHKPDLYLVNVRRADCLARLGDAQQATKVLNELLAHNIPDNMRSAIQVALAQLNQQKSNTRRVG